MSIRFATAMASAAFAAAMTVSAEQQQTPPPTTQTPAPAGQMRTFTPEEMAAFRAVLPEGEARDLVIRVCAQCHEPNRAAALRLTREGWEGVIQKMRGLGAQANDQESAQITDYLSENFKGEAPKPINMNTASSVDLEAVAGLLRKEAALWIAYRNKNGPCKSLDDLKKVDGLPFKKIDDRRDRLGCF
jgi:mono/diheme cytochrome c family protein